jgi:TPR repeat protein
MRSAFRLYLAGAKSGDSGCQLNVGNLYDAGTGVRRNPEAALHWYKRAYRAGSASAANNIGVLWRGDRKFFRPPLNSNLPPYPKRLELLSLAASCFLANSSSVSRSSRVFSACCGLLCTFGSAGPLFSTRSGVIIPFVKMRRP